MPPPVQIPQTRRVLLIVAVMLAGACGSGAEPEQFAFEGSAKRDQAVEYAVDQMGSEVAIDPGTMQGVAFETPIGPFDVIRFVGVDDFGRSVECQVSGGDRWGSVSSCGVPNFGDLVSGVETRLALQKDGWVALEFAVEAAVSRIEVRLPDGTDYEVTPRAGVGVVAWPRERGCPESVRAFDANDTQLMELTDFEAGPRSVFDSEDDQLCA